MKCLTLGELIKWVTCLYVKWGQLQSSNPSMTWLKVYYRFSFHGYVYQIITVNNVYKCITMGNVCVWKVDNGDTSCKVPSRVWFGLLALDAPDPLTMTYARLVYTRIYVNTA